MEADGNHCSHGLENTTSTANMKKLRTRRKQVVHAVLTAQEQTTDTDKSPIFLLLARYSIRSRLKALALAESDSFAVGTRADDNRERYRGSPEGRALLEIMDVYEGASDNCSLPSLSSTVCAEDCSSVEDSSDFSDQSLTMFQDDIDKGDVRQYQTKKEKKHHQTSSFT